MIFNKIKAATLLVALMLGGVVAARTKVACVGNSITYGMTIDDRENNSYPSRLARMLGDEYEVGNFGKNGATLLVKGHRPYVKQEEFKAALEFAPDIVVIHLGVNDTDPRDYPDYGDFFVEDYVALIDSFKKVNPEVRVIVANLSPILSKHPRFKSGTREWRDKIRGLIPAVANVAGAELIDFGEALRDRPDLITDGVHPNAQGAAILAETVRGAITGDYGGLKMPQIYGDGMVLQRYRPLRINGTANAADTVAVSIKGNTARAVADNRGRWSATLPPMKEGTGYTMTVTDGHTTLTFNDIAVGEVWIASGQSNMAFTMAEASTFNEDRPRADDSLLRFFDMKFVAETNPGEWSDEKKAKTDSLAYYLPARWQASSSETAGPFSAVGWYFGKALRDSLNVPVGIISNAVGGSPTEAWIDIETLEHELPEILVDWRTNDFIQPWVRQRAVENATADRAHRHPYEPSYLFASGIRPLASYPLAGTIWYQGESNAHNIEAHERLFTMLVKSWRENWEQPSMPFIFVQLSSINRPSWPAFRDSQRRLADMIPDVAMAVSMDHGDSLDVHPRNKRVVGQRLARQALNRVYSMTNVVPEGPKILRAERIAPGTLLLTFDYGDGMKSSDGMPIRTFEVAETEGLYRPAQSVEILDNKTIKIICMEIENPKFVRYGWQPFTRANLVNGDSLPASTFKIAVTEGRHAEKGIECGVSAAYVGMTNGRVIRAGGCNFPENPMAPDSQKKFYEGVYALIPNADGSLTAERIGTLPAAIAYGAAVPTPDGLVLIGGTTASESLSSAWLLTVNDEGQSEFKPLPSLPVTVDNHAAACLDGKIYVAGGNVNGQPSNALYCLDMAHSEKGWTALTPMPGNPRVQPVMAAANGMLYVWGGFAGKGPGRDASLETDGVAFNPRNKKWTKVAGPVDYKGNEVSTGGGVAATLPDGRIVVAGGVNKDVFLDALRNQAPDYLSHPAEWYRFNDLVFIFDPATQRWNISQRNESAARAGAGIAVTPEGEVIISGGEIKPRIRTADIICIKP